MAHLDLRCPFRPVQLLYPKCYRPSCCSGSRRTHCSLYLGLDRRSPPVFRPASRPTPQTAQKMGLRGQDEATVFGFETSGATSGVRVCVEGRLSERVTEIRRRGADSNDRFCGVSADSASAPSKDRSSEVGGAQRSIFGAINIGRSEQRSIFDHAVDRSSTVRAANAQW